LTFAISVEVHVSTKYGVSIGFLFQRHGTGVRTDGHSDREGAGPHNHRFVDLVIFIGLVFEKSRFVSLDAISILFYNSEHIHHRLQCMIV